MVEDMNKILVIDDNVTNVKILKIILEKAGYETETVTDPLMATAKVKEVNPGLILLDINMPEIDGFTLCREFKKDETIRDIPVIFISALSDDDSMVDGFHAGGVDYILKPFKAETVKARAATHLQIHELQRELETANKILEDKVKEQVQQISDMQMETIFSLAKLAQSRDDDTGKHLERVQKYCSILATQLKKDGAFDGLITDDFIKNIVNASTLHDIGKVGITDLILLKPGKLTEEEFETMKTHTIIGAETLDDVDKKFGNNAFIEIGKVIARHHHERWDGRGYPDKLAGEEIPIAARIMAIADVYDALSQKRVYKEAFSHEKCIQIIKESSGSQFDPVIVDAFLKTEQEFYETREALKD